MNDAQKVNDTLNDLELLFDEKPALCRADVVKVKIYIESLHIKIKNLESEIECIKRKGR